jgi:hypothetical protein
MFVTYGIVNAISSNTRANEAEVKRLRAMIKTKEAAKRFGDFMGLITAPVAESVKRRVMNNSIAQQAVSTYTAITNLSGNLQKTILLKDLGSIVAGFSTGTDSRPKINAANVALDVSSTNNFIVTPFIAFLQNSETISSQELPNSDPLSAIYDPGTTGSKEKLIDIGHSLQGRQTVAAAESFRARLAMDISPFMEAYSILYAQEELEERDHREIMLGAVVRTTDNATNVNFRGYISYQCTQVEHKILL